MAFEYFQKKVTYMTAKCRLSAKFFRNNDTFLAKCSDGTTIVGSPRSSRVLVRWGNGHEAFANF